MLCSLELAAEVVHLALQILYHRGQLLKIHPDLLFQARHPVNTGNSVLCFTLASLAVPDNGALQKHSEGHRHHGGKEKWREWEGVWVPWHARGGYRYSAASGRD